MTDLVQRAATLRDAQHMDEALDTIRKAATLNPDDPRAAFGLAQISFECWQPAADLFAKARQLVPANADVIRNHALALAAEGESGSAQLLLEDTLAVAPGWVEGHRILAVQRITEGNGTDFDRSFVIAAKVEPENVALYMAWFQLHAQRKDWKRAANVLNAAQARLPGNRTLELAALYLASESGDARNDPTLFDTVADLADPGIDLCRVRHDLRAGDPTRAMMIAERHLQGPTARMFWPYVALCWRLLDDPRAAWLDGTPIFAAALDLEFSPSELDQLAQVLRGLHRLKAPYPDQSVRGGTQTDRQLFFHPHPAIQKTRQKVSAAVQSFIGALPAQDAGHPLLGPQRNQPILFEGSWSVRLAGAGYHAAHTHVMGWISSALYIVVPEPDVAGPAPAGHLALGAPPPELGLSMEPIRYIEPKAGRLALFPSTLWHGTEPFAEGERMTIAFDIRIPQITEAF